MKGLKADDDLFYFISSINYSINISITAPGEAEDSMSASQDWRSAQVLAHHTRASGSTWRRLSLQFIICSPAERMDSARWLCVWWTEVASERNEMILHLKWMGIINTNQIEASSEERGFVWFVP